jgi:transposase
MIAVKRRIAPQLHTKGAGPEEHCHGGWSGRTQEGPLYRHAGRGRNKRSVTDQLATEPNAVRRFVQKLEREAPGPVQMCYEAGPWRHALQRQVTTPTGELSGHSALILRKLGERIKTNRRDARKLVELLRAPRCFLRSGRRRLDTKPCATCVARAMMRDDLQQSRHHLGILLLSRGLNYSNRN